jgi:hypothetical protein
MKNLLLRLTYFAAALVIWPFRVALVLLGYSWGAIQALFIQSPTLRGMQLKLLASGFFLDLGPALFTPLAVLFASNASIQVGIAATLGRGRK